MSEVAQTGNTQTVVVDTATVVVEAGAPLVVVSGMMGPAGASDLADMGDVDTTQLQDGCVLVYKQATQRWTATNTLDRQILDGGQF